MGKEFHIPYWEIPIRTGYNEDGDYRFGKFTLIGINERENEETEEMVDDAKLDAEGKGKEVYSSGI